MANSARRHPGSSSPRHDPASARGGLRAGAARARRSEPTPRARQAARAGRRGAGDAGDRRPLPVARRPGDTRALPYFEVAVLAERAPSAWRRSMAPAYVLTPSEAWAASAKDSGGSPFGRGLGRLDLLRHLDLPLEDLARRALGQLVGEPDLARVLVARHLVLDVARAGRTRRRPRPP